MRNRILVLALMLGAMVYSTGCTKVEPGYVGVKVFLAGNDKGVAPEVVGPGRYYIGWNTELFEFPTFQQNYSWTKNPNEGSSNDESFDMQTGEGQSVSCDIAVTYHYDVDKIPYLFQTFREGNDEIRDKQLHNFVRNAMNLEASKYMVSDIYGPKKIQFISDVTKDVRLQVAPQGIIVDDLSLIGSFRLPEGVTAALNAKNEAVQKAQQVQNEVAESRAEAEKAVAIAQGEAQSTLIRAEAQAKANRVISSSLTRELIESRKVDKWNGEYPQIVAGGASNGILINTNGLSTKKSATADAKEDTDSK